MAARTQTFTKIDVAVAEMLRASRIPGAAIAIVVADNVVHARGYGYRDLRGRKPVTARTLYPIASTSKAMNATLLGMLVDEEKVQWDAPVQRYLPQFRLHDTAATQRTTVRDLVTMRTGLPRHDWVWWRSRMTRVDLMCRLPHLEPTADFRQRFQYSNLTTAVAGHVAEIVTGKRWETLVQQRIFGPLQMHATACSRPKRGDFTMSYHEDMRRRLLLTPPVLSPVAAPAGSAIQSTVSDMAKWVLFNLSGGTVGGRQLIAPTTMAQVHAPQVVIGDRPLAGLPAQAAYGLGWVVDYYNGHQRVWHGGNLDEVNSCVMFFPKARIGMVSFTNFGAPQLADLLNEHAFDLIMELKHVQSVDEKLKQYEVKVEQMRKRAASLTRTVGAQPTHPLDAYTGKYVHAGYGEVAVSMRRHKLHIRRDDLLLPLRHWHHDVWLAEAEGMWAIHVPQTFDRVSLLQFQSDALGRVDGLSIPFEPELAPIRFRKQH